MSELLLYWIALEDLSNKLATECTSDKLLLHCNSVCVRHTV